MIGYIMVGTNDLDRAIKFYDELFKILDLERTETDDVCAGYSQKGSNGKIEFYVTKPVNKKEATIGNGSQVSFLTNTRNIVDKFHELGLHSSFFIRNPFIRNQYSDSKCIRDYGIFF